MTRPRILIVEDEGQVARLLESYLNRLGHAVAGVADNGADALRLAATERPALALLDIELAGPMDGIELAAQLWREHNLPTMFLTGRSDEATLEQVRKSDSFGYLLKPVRLEELKAGVELALIRHGRETRLAQVERLFSAAIHGISDAVLLTDAAGLVTYLNPAAERLTGWPAHTATGRALDAIFRDRDDATGTAFITRDGAATPGRAGPNFPREWTLLTADFRPLPVEVSLASIRNDRGDVTGTVLLARDITERKRLEAQLRKSQAELRSLAGHLEQAREAERTRIAREIHDEFGQMLTAFKFDLAWLEKKLADPNPPAATTLQTRIHSMSVLLRGMVQSVRRIAMELRPGLLDTLGLEAAVEWQANDFQQRTGIRCTVTAGLPDDAVSRPLATALFRVLQESLTNVARHAGARTVHVRLEARAGRVLLEVRDDGHGVQIADLQKPGAFGLLGIRERVSALGGECDIQSEPGRGTTVRVSVPRQLTSTSDRP